MDMTRYVQHPAELWRRLAYLDAVRGLAVVIAVIPQLFHVFVPEQIAGLVLHLAGIDDLSFGLSLTVSSALSSPREGEQLRDIPQVKAKLDSTIAIGI